jgi:hypothetical protein
MITVYISSSFKSNVVNNLDKNGSETCTHLFSFPFCEVSFALNELLVAYSNNYREEIRVAISKKIFFSIKA